MHLCISISRMKPFSLQHILSIFAPVKSSKLKILSLVFLVLLLVIHPYAYLVVHVGRIFDHTTHANLRFVPNNVFSWVIMHNIKVSSAMIFLPVEYLFLVMWSSMKLFFLSDIYILTSVTYFAKKSFYYRIICLVFITGTTIVLTT